MDIISFQKLQYISHSENKVYSFQKSKAFKKIFYFPSCTYPIKQLGEKFALTKQKKKESLDNTLI